MGIAFFCQDASGVVDHCSRARKTMLVIILSVQKNGSLSFFSVQFELQAMAKSDAPGILGAIDKAFLDELGLQGNEWREKIVGMGTDGAAVMTGVRSGVVARVKADVPHLISVHCVALIITSELSKLSNITGLVSLLIYIAF